MILTDNKKLCEEIEIAILSDENLTEEQKNHIECCESCKALLSQTQKMKKDLGTLGVPGLKDGQITEVVMQNVRKQKLSAPFPGFKITHHLGTAAAVVIILAAALIVKNPSVIPNDNKLSAESVVEDASENKVHELTRHVLGTVVETEETADSAGDNTLRAVPSNETEAVEESALPAQEKNTNDGYLYSIISDAPASKETNESMTYDYADTELAENETEKSAPTVENGINDVIYDSSSVLMSANDGTDDVDTVQIEEYEQPSKKLSSAGSGAIVGAAGGGSSGSSAVADRGSVHSTEEADNDNFKLSLPVLPQGMTSAFDGIEFLVGEENLDYNIAIANKRLSELFGENYVIDKKLLAEAGCTTNADFLVFVSDGISYEISE